MNKYLNLAWRVPVFVLIWALFVFIKLPTVILGIFMVPFLWRLRDVLYDRLPGWTRPWANPEDWHGGPQSYSNSLPQWWADKHGQNEWSFYRYHAIRNPANGLRSFEFLDLDIDRERVRYVTNGLLDHYEPWHMRKLDPVPQTAWYWCWQSWQAGFKYVHLWNETRHTVIKLGWRVQPQDAHRDIGPGIRREDSGFASKFLLYRKG